jgi:stearoyl-CoA desaturase (delta-9 desaturase)
MASETVTSIPTTADVARFSPRHLLFIVPLTLLHLACGLVFVVGTSRIATTVFVITSAVQMFGITTGYHRLLAHRSFKTSRPFQLVLVFFGALAAQNGPLWWVAHHRYHHMHPDQDGDLHSPRAGLFWSHMGWLFSTRCLHAPRHLTADLAELPELRFLDRYGYVVTGGYAVLLTVLGEVWRRVDPGAGTGGPQLFVWGSVISTVVVYHGIWLGNSVCHRYGTRRFPTRDDSRNNILVSLLTFGDGWHHNHHYCPSSARHGFRWWEIDVNYVILRLLARVGLVWDLKLPPKRTLAERCVGSARRRVPEVSERESTGQLSM